MEKNLNKSLQKFKHDTVQTPLLAIILIDVNNETLLS